MAQDRVTIPLGKVNFDQGALTGTHLWSAYDMLPTVSGYTVFQGWTENISTALAESIYGVGEYLGDTSNLLVAGGATKIYDVTSGLTAIGRQEAPTLGPNYNTATVDSGWFFTQFGPYIFGTNGIDNIQIMNALSGTQFTDITPAANCANPAARYIVSHKNHILIAYVTLGAGYGTVLSAGDHPNLLWWSGLDNGVAFGEFTTSPAIDATGWKQIYDGNGVITGLCGGYDAAFLFKTHSIHRIDGPPFQVNCINDGIGCIHPRSISRLGDRIYFWSSSGPAYIDTTSNEVTILSESELNAAILSVQRNALSSVPLYDSKTNVSPVGAYTYNSIRSFVDAQNKFVAFQIEIQIPGVTPSSPTSIKVIYLTYAERTDSWSLINSPQTVVGYPHTGYGSATGQTFSANTIHYSDAITYKQYVPVGNTGTNTGRLRLPFIPFTNVPGQATRIIAFKVRFRRGENYHPVQFTLGNITYSYSLYTTSDVQLRWMNYGGAYADVVYSSTPITSFDGWVHIPNSKMGLWHSLEVGLSCDGPGDQLAAISSIEVIYETIGLRSA